MAGQYFDAQPAVPSRPATVKMDLPEGQVELEVDSGVFSARGVDAGTVELLRAVERPGSSAALLDLGCGYGPIAVALALACPESQVWAVDVNERALELTRRNAARLGLANIRVATPDSVPDAVTFDGIWSNPPIRVGKVALHDLLARWLPRLAPGAPAWLVVQRHLGSDSLATWMTGVGWAVERVSSRKGYRILKVVPSP